MERTNSILFHYSLDRPSGPKRGSWVPERYSPHECRAHESQICLLCDWERANAAIVEAVGSVIGPLVQAALHRARGKPKLQPADAASDGEARWSESQ